MACIKGAAKAAISISPKDLRWDYFRSGGKGGQHQNKTETGCRVTHVPTGLSCERRERSRKNNVKLALEELVARLQAREDEAASGAEASLRRLQVGSGQRGDKIRTYALQRGTVTDHLTGKIARASDVLSGNLDLLR